MKQLISILLIIFLTGCSWFSYYDNLQDCDALLNRSKVQLKQSIVIIDSLELELKKCQ